MFHQQLALFVTLGLASCAVDSGTGAPSLSSSVDNPEDDVDLRHFLQNPPVRLAVTPDCIASSPDGTTQTTPPLHISPGTTLRCTTIEMPAIAAQDVMDSTHGRWCLNSRMRPETARIQASNDRRVTWSLQSPVQPDASWTITGVPATTGSFDLATVDFFGAQIYPVFAEVHSTALELRPNPTNTACENVFAE
jgi:hypothetical protein